MCRVTLHNFATLYATFLVPRALRLLQHTQASVQFPAQTRSSTARLLSAQPTDQLIDKYINRVFSK